MIQAEIIPPGEIAEPRHRLPSDALHNYYHRAAQSAAAQAAHFAVLCGLELKRIQKEVARVQPALVWKDWVAANCEFSYETGTRYIRVAEGIKGKIAAQAGSAESLRLLDTPAAQLDGSDRAKLMQTVGRVTEGDTLRQLYLDFGIIKGNARDNLKKGGATHKTGRTGNAPATDLDAEDAEATVSDILTSLAKWFASGSHQHLSKAKLLQLDGHLVAARETLAPFIR